MRSVRVVLPESIWAEIPMFRRRCRFFMIPGITEGGSRGDLEGRDRRIKEAPPTTAVGQARGRINRCRMNRVRRNK